MEILKAWGWLITLAVLAIAAALWWTRSRPAMPIIKPRGFHAEDWKPRTMRPLTKTELRVMMHLREALPDCLLMPQISLSRFLQVGHNRSYQHWFSAVGRRSVDFLVCSKQGDVLGAVMLLSAVKSDSSGTQRKRKTLELARIPLWEMKASDLPSIDSIRVMVMAEAQAAEQHSQLASQMHADSEWKATELQPRVKTGTAKMQGVETMEIDDARWNQAWPSEEASASAFLDSDAMGLPELELPPLQHKGSARTHGQVR
jgi:hypothetical protein